ASEGATDAAAGVDDAATAEASPAPAADAPSPASPVEAAPHAEAPEGHPTPTDTQATTGGREPKRALARTLGELNARLHHLARSGRAARGAIDQLGAALMREPAIPGVACRVIPAFARDREQVSFIRSVLGLLRPPLPAVLEFADGPRSTAGLGLTLAHG